MPRRVRRTYLILSAQHYDGQWVRTPRLVQRLETRSDPYALYLSREHGASVAVVEPPAYPELEIREQR